MHRCPNCGREFEGKFCPECGNEWQDEKTCPNCGTKLDGAAKFCNECGYTFTRQQPPAQQPQPQNQPNKILSWLKAHKKPVIILSVLLVIAIALGCAIPAVIKAAPNGTYYRVGNKEIDYQSFYTLNSGEWTDQDGVKGTYEKNGDKITFYMGLFGETMKFGEGTLKNNVLDMEGDKYVSQKHSHEFSSFPDKSAKDATCTEEGEDEYNCRTCGFIEVRKSEMLPHREYQKTDGESHWMECVDCKQETSQRQSHDSLTGCTGCGYPLYLEQRDDNEFDDDPGYYMVSDVWDKNVTEITVPATFKGLPVTKIWNAAFRDCKLLTKVTLHSGITEYGGYLFSGCSKLESIPENLTYIGDSMFYGCSSLVTARIADGVTEIGQSAFNTCRSLKEIYIPKSVTSLKGYIIMACWELTDIHYDGTKDDWAKIAKDKEWDITTSKSYTVHCTDGDLTMEEAH